MADLKNFVYRVVDADCIICLPPSADVEPGGGAELVLAVLGPRREVEALQLPEVVGRAGAAPRHGGPVLGGPEPRELVLVLRVPELGQRRGGVAPLLLRYGTLLAHAALAWFRHEC